MIKNLKIYGFYLLKRFEIRSYYGDAIFMAKELDKRDQIKGLKKERKEALASFDKQFKKIMKEW